MFPRRLAIAAAALALALPPSASALDIPSTAIFVTPIGEGRVALGDDGKDHVEYDLLVTNIFDKPVTLSRLEVLDPAGTVLMTMEGDARKAATFVIDRFTVTGTIAGGDFSGVEITPQNCTVENAYPLVDGIATFE